MKPEYIVLHHSLTKDRETVSWGAIRKYHKDVNKWSDIGYHYGVELVNDYYEILMGRFPDEVGAHAKEAGMNWKSLGICMVGNFDEEEPPTPLIERTLELVKWLQYLYDISDESVIGHREVGMMAGFDWTKGEYKSCPGKKFPLEEIRKSLASP